MTTMTGTAQFEIEPLGEYSLRESAGFIGGWVQPSGDGAAGAGHLHLAFLTDDAMQPAGVCLTQDDGAVRGEIHGDAAPEAVKGQVARILSLDVDGRGWPDVGRRDPVVGMLQQAYPGFRPVNWSNAYEAAAWCILSSRVNMRQAQAVKDRMCRELGDEVDIHGHRMWAFPSPERLAAVESFPGLFGRKAEYLSRLAGSALAGDLDTDSLRLMPEDEALAHLKRLAGIGDFGAQLIRLRAVGAVDELPGHEPRLLHAVKLAYGLAEEPDMTRLQELARAWSPFTMWVCVCLRRTLGGQAGMRHSRASG